MHGVFSNSLWYLEFFAFMVVLVLFFYFILYLAQINYAPYSPKFDKKKQVSAKLPLRPKQSPSPEPRQTPLCLEESCIWFCRLVGSIATIGVCYYFAYFLLSDTKLKFGIFVP